MHILQKLLLVLLFTASITKSYARLENVLRYYNLINKAEGAICNKNLVQAASYYRQASMINREHMTYGDLLNAFFSAMDTRQYQLAAQYFSKLRLKGMTNQNAAHIASYFGTDSIKVQAYALAYPEIPAAPAFMGDTIEAMFNRDQGTRSYFTERNPDGNYMTDSVHKVDKANALQLHALFIKYGVGPFLKATSGNYAKCWVIVYHNMGTLGADNQLLFDTLLYNAVFTYDIDLTLFETLINQGAYAYKDQCFRYKGIVLKLPVEVRFGSYGFGEKEEIWPEYLPPQQETAINKERAKLALPPIENIRRNTLFSKAEEKKKSKYAKYALRRSTLYIGARDEAERDEMKEKYLKYKPKGK